MENNLGLKIREVVSIFLEKTKDKEIQIISHFDTDGITSAAIMIQTLKYIDRKFNLKIVKSLDQNFINSLQKNKIILFLDLASGSLEHIKNSDLEEVFIIDHHEVAGKIPENVNIINPHLHEKQKISSSGLTYLFSKEIDSKNKKFAKLAALGMIGDRLEKEIEKYEILDDPEVKIKKGLLIYPATRPLNRVLEFSSSPYIPGVTGDIKGVIELLCDAGLNPVKGKYKSLLELDENEMEKLVTSILLRNPLSENKKIIGDVFLIKLYNQLEDARELSAKINACSRSGRSDVAIQFCMEVSSAKKNVEKIHSKYKQELISSLELVQKIDSEEVSSVEKIIGENFVIINVKNKIKDTMIGTVASILSNSSIYKEETTIIAMAFNEIENKIKISARNVGSRGRNVREVLDRVITLIGGEVGGHEFAAGGTIDKEKEQEFLECLKRNLEIEMIKI
ncbi:MAG TPA: DHH family phosphoesterase [Candidatus Nanoarchaeia archaeon]|nr:DHH family phosphoesterase [Candidatus Nanoarchaeia archaeon]